MYKTQSRKCQERYDEAAHNYNENASTEQLFLSDRVLAGRPGLSRSKLRLGGDFSLAERNRVGKMQACFLGRAVDCDSYPPRSSPTSRRRFLRG